MALTLAAIIAVAFLGLNFGVDFKGGSVLELTFAKDRPSITDLTAVVTADTSVKDAAFSPVGDKGVIMKAGELKEADHQAVLQALQKKYPDAGLEEVRFDSVGPAVGKELKSKSITAIIVVLIAIAVYIALVFRKLSRSLSPWNMSLATMVALLHDVIIPVGVFAVLGRYGHEVSAVFVAALLTILGYSISDTVVVFDRIRENLLRGQAKGEDFAALVHRSIMQTLVRSINTSMTVLLALAAVYFFGGESIKFFALALIIGVFAGAYSSIFVASPLLVWLTKRGK